MPDNQAYAKSKALPTGTTRLSSPVLNIPRGPGWLTMWSPNAAVRWLVRGSQDQVAEEIYVETGPASKARVWIGQMGTSAFVHSVDALLNGIAEVDQANGRIVTGVPATERAEANVRFYPSWVCTELGDGSPPHGAGQYNPLVGNQTTTIPIIACPAGTVDIGFPPEERFSLTVLADRLMSIEVSNLAGGKLVLYTSAGSLMHTLNVSPWHFVSIICPPGPDTNLQILWRDIGAITNA